MGLSNLLEIHENEAISSSLAGENVEASTVVELYRSYGQSWSKECTGCAVVTTQGPVSYLKILDINDQSLLFTQEIYRDFVFEELTPFLRAFETDDSVVAFSFADDNESYEFSQTVESIQRSSNTPSHGGAVPPPPSSRPPPRPTSPQTSNPPPVPFSGPPVQSAPPLTSFPVSNSSNHHNNNTGSGAQSPSTPKKDSAAEMAAKAKDFKKKLFGFFSKTDDDIDNLTISDPSNFRHMSSIGWNPGESSFEIRNIPPEWRKLFQAAGITKNDLKNKETAAFVMNIIDENSGGGGGAPPPPPCAPAPPPPPVPGASANKPSERANLLSQIQGGAHLKTVDRGEEKSSPAPTAGLADTLAKAMDARRHAISSNNQENEADEWSDG